MWDWISELGKQNQMQLPFAIVTIIRCSGSTPREVGAKMLVLENGSLLGTIGGGNLEKMISEDAITCIREGVSKVSQYPLGAKTGQCCGGIVEVFIECLHTGPRVYIFGAGHVGIAVCQVLEETTFRIHLIDERKEWIGSDRIPKGVIRHALAWDDFLDSAQFSKDSFVIIMTHSHAFDFSILMSILKTNVRYIGLIGSQSKWLRFSTRLLARGFSQNELSRVHCPIGLPTGGKSPKEVAISLAAELLSIYYGGNLTASPIGSREITASEISERATALQKQSVDNTPAESIL